MQLCFFQNCKEKEGYAIIFPKMFNMGILFSFTKLHVHEEVFSDTDLFPDTFHSQPGDDLTVSSSIWKVHFASNLF
jgi:hypothetical protein